MRLYGPIDALFFELKQRIERVPSARQREAAMIAKAQTNPPAPNKPISDEPSND